jgi:hypothetical protein
MPHSNTLARLAQFAEDQWGLITRQQALRAGIPLTTLKRLIRNGSIERVASAVYHLAGAPVPDHMALRAAWLQLAPDIPSWRRTPDQGVVSHRSAAAVYGVGHLPADRHEFTLPHRRQSRRPDVRLHQGAIGRWIELRGLPVTRPSVIVADLLSEREDPTAVGHIVVDAIRAVYDYPGTFADALAPHAVKFGLRPGDGVALLRWLLDLVGDPETGRWIEEARAHIVRTQGSAAATSELASGSREKRT